MGGERLFGVELGGAGLPGDRLVGVMDRASRRPDRPLSAREVPVLLAFSAVWAGGEALISGPGLPLASHRSPEAAAAVSEACGRRVELADQGAPAFDDSPIHLISVPTLRQLQGELAEEVDPRRFRANVYLDGGELEAGEESRWTGQVLEAGRAALVVLGDCPRCAVTTREPGHPEREWPGLLRHLVGRRAQVMGVYAKVGAPGPLHAGDPVRVTSGVA